MWSLCLFLEHSSVHCQATTGLQQRERQYYSTFTVFTVVVEISVCVGVYVGLTQGEYTNVSDAVI